MPPVKYLAGGLQSSCTANSTGAQYKCREREEYFSEANARKGFRLDRMSERDC